MNAPRSPRKGSQPKRIRLSRTKGWRLPPNTVVVARPTKWGNPHHITRSVDRATAVARYREDMKDVSEERVAEIRRELRGKNLACWCPLDEPCHADVLLEIANS